jgi:thioredoxin 1
LTPAEVRAVFDSFDSDGSGALSVAELTAAVRSLGVRFPPDELQALVAELDVDRSDTIEWPEFQAWWNALVLSSPVTFLHTEAEFDGVLEEEATSGRLVVLQVGFSYCKPCKAFEPKFKAFAKHYTSARFLRVNGNENVEMVHLGRDRLRLRSSPSFFFFVNGQEVHRHSGASEEKMQVALNVWSNSEETPLIVTNAGAEIFEQKGGTTPKAKSEPAPVAR